MNDTKTDLLLALTKAKSTESSKLRYDYSYFDQCMKAVNDHGDRLQFVPETLKTPELCLAAVTKDGNALEYVPQSKRTPDLCMVAVAQSGFALKHVHRSMITAQMCVVAIEQTPHCLRNVPEAFQTPELCMAAVSKSGASLACLPDEKITPELCVAAVKENVHSLVHVPEYLVTPELCLMAMREDIKTIFLKHIPEEMQNFCHEYLHKDVTDWTHTDYAVATLQCNPAYLQIMSEDDLNLEPVKQLILERFDEILKANSTDVMEAVIKKMDDSIAQDRPVQS